MSPNSSITDFGLEPKSVMDTNILGGTMREGILTAYEKMMNGGKQSTRMGRPGCREDMESILR